MSITVFPPKQDSATIPLVFDFLSQLESTETISSHVCDCVVEVGTDANPENVLSGSTSVEGKQVTQLITGGVVGAIYRVSCDIVTSLGQHLTMYGRVAVLGSTPYQS